VCIGGSELLIKGFISGFFIGSILKLKFFMKQQPSRLKFRKNHKVGSSFLFLRDQKTFFANSWQVCTKELAGR